MAISVNKVTLIGRLGQDPSRSSDRAPVKCSVATSRTWKDRQSGERREKTEWHNVVVWNEQAGKFLEQYAKKGDLVYIEGELETRKWEKDGVDRYTTEVVVHPYSGSAQLQSKDGGGGDREDREERRGVREDSRSSGGGFGGSGGYSRDIDDEIPF